MYFVSVALAICVAVACTLFSFVAGLGSLFLLSTVISVLLLTGGAGLSISNPRKGVWISGVGAAICAMALIAGLVQLIEAIPFREQPEQTSLLATPSVFLLVAISHLAAALNKYKTMTRSKVAQ